MIRLYAALLAIMVGGSASEVAAQRNAAQRIANPSKCGLSHSRDRRTGLPAPADCRSGLAVEVTGGSVAPQERHTAAITFTTSKGERDICSGILLDDRHVLTAGHCGCGIANSYQVTFSQFARKGDLTSNALEIDGGPILYDPLTCLRGIAPGTDLALLRLKKLVPSDVVPAGYPFFFLASDEQMKPVKEMKVVGFGVTETGGIAVRMKAQVPVLTPDCFDPPYNLYCAPFREMILADREGRANPRDTCGGDSGGPVFARRIVSAPECGILPPEEVLTVTQSEDVVVAITSRAAPFTAASSNQPCGQGGIYTLIGRRSIYAWLDRNHVKPQTCLIRRQ